MARVHKKDQKEVQILPFRYGLQLTEEGLIIFLENYWLKGLTDESYKKLFAFHLEYESPIHTLCYISEMKPILFYGDGVEPISTFKEHYDYMARNRLFDNHFISETLQYPISLDSLLSVIHRFVSFYPIYDSYIHIAMGLEVRFNDLIKTLNQWLKSSNELDSEEEENLQGNPALISEQETLKARQAAEQRIRVMPSLRWQVFQRDHWRCIACGRGSQDDVILHVDHIIPRSKGGKDTLENYQTLCHECNIGKSNKDATDLRGKKSKARPSSRI